MLTKTRQPFLKRAYLLCLPTLLLVTGFVFTPPLVAQNQETIHIGVLAKRGKTITQQKWAATADYLQQAITSKKFDIIPLSFDEIDLKVSEQSVDFILLNPTMYVQLENTHKVSSIATLVSKYSNNDATTLGSVIISKADKLTLNTTKDVLDKSVAAVNPRSLGGWEIALARLKHDDIDMVSDVKSLRFLGTHDLVIQAVLKGAADIGIVRSGTLEQMEEEGKISLNDFSVLPSENSNVDYPQLTSTRLYPDWAFAKSAHVSDQLANQVAAALLLMTPQDKAAYSAAISGWTNPKNYVTVHELLAELELPPYHEQKTTSIPQFALEHLPVAISVIAAFFILIIMYLRQKVLTRELRHAQNSLKNYSNRLQLAAEAGELGIWEWNIKKNKFYADDRISQLFGLENTTNTYTTQDWYSRVHPDDIERVQTAMHLALSGGKKFDAEYRILKNNNEFCAVKSAAIHRYSKSRNGLVVNGVTWDISSHRQLVEENKRLATLDPLTSAKNRRGFFPLARAEFNRCRRYGNKLALLMIDIDDFKKINDINGHSAGDATLVSLSDICHTVFRTSDLFCRLGGEEFVALLHENNIEQAHIVAERLRKEIEKTSVRTDKAFTKFTVSIGIAVLIEPDQTIEDTITRADKALYKAKQQGKNCVASDI